MAPAVFIFLVTLVARLFFLTRLNKKRKEEKKDYEVLFFANKNCAPSLNTEVVSGEQIRHALYCLFFFFYMAHSFGKIYEILLN